MDRFPDEFRAPPKKEEPAQNLETLRRVIHREVMLAMKLEHIQVTLYMGVDAFILLNDDFIKEISDRGFDVDIKNRKPDVGWGEPFRCKISW